MSHFNFFEPDQTRYELEELLGEGLNSKVFRAVRVDAGGLARQRVALKFLKDQTSVSFLRREFETLARVRSKYCARVIAWETQNGESVLAMEWIDGLTLYDLSRRVSLDETHVNEIIRQIYLGLCDLRAAGLFHGDLQPRNVMIDREGCVRLIDFANGTSADGSLQATAAFAAPEVRKEGRLSFTADLFALGMIERNISTGFRNLDASENSQRDSSLLKTDPASRFFNDKHSENPRAQAELAKLIALALSQTASLSTELIRPTDLSPSRQSLHPLLKTAVGLALLLLSAVTVPVMAEAPPEIPELSAKLGVTSEHWFQIQLNGKDAGFSPLMLSHLRAGPHRITWKSAGGEGELRLVLSAGRTIHLTESRDGSLKVR